MSYYYNIKTAGHVIGIWTMYLQTGVFLKKYAVQGESPELTVRMTEEDIRNEWRRMLQNPRYEADFVNRLPGYYFESFALNRKVSDALLPFNTIAFHGSAIVVDGGCHIFSADSGTGKSTFARLCAGYYGSRAFILNDDKPFLHLEGHSVTCFGSPWDGKHHTGTNTSAPLSSVCFLERAEKSSVAAVPASEGLEKIRYQVFRPDDPADFEMAEKLLRNISENVRFFRVGFTLDRNDVEPVFNNLKEEMS